MSDRSASQRVRQRTARPRPRDARGTPQARPSARPRGRRAHPRRRLRADPAARVRQHDRRRGRQHTPASARRPSTAAGRARRTSPSRRWSSSTATRCPRPTPARSAGDLRAMFASVLAFVNSPAGIDYVRTSITESMRDDRIAALYREANRARRAERRPRSSSARSPAARCAPDIHVRRRRPVPRRPGRACAPSPDEDDARRSTRSTSLVDVRAARHQRLTPLSLRQPVEPWLSPGRAARRRTPRGRTAPGRPAPRRGRPASPVRRARAARRPRCRPWPSRRAW